MRRYILPAIPVFLAAANILGCTGGSPENLAKDHGAYLTAPPSSALQIQPSQFRIVTLLEDDRYGYPEDIDGLSLACGPRGDTLIVTGKASSLKRGLFCALQFDGALFSLDSIKVPESDQDIDTLVLAHETVPGRIELGAIDKGAGTSAQELHGSADGQVALLELRFRPAPVSRAALSDAPPDSAVWDASLSYEVMDQRFTVTTRKLRGDYNLDGRVSITDLVPIAANLGRRADSASTQTSDWDAIRHIDGNNDDIINAADLTLIGLNYGHILPSRLQLFASASTQQDMPTADDLHPRVEAVSTFEAMPTPADNAGNVRNYLDFERVSPGLDYWVQGSSADGKVFYLPTQSIETGVASSEQFGLEIDPDSFMFGGEISDYEMQVHDYGTELLIVVYADVFEAPDILMGGISFDPARFSHIPLEEISLTGPYGITSLESPAYLQETGRAWFARNFDNEATNGYKTPVLLGLLRRGPQAALDKSLTVSMLGDSTDNEYYSGYLDPQFSWNASTGTLSWRYFCAPDGNQNGRVDYFDFEEILKRQLGRKTIDYPAESATWLADYNNDGYVSVSDASSVFLRYLQSIDGFNVMVQDPAALDPVEGRSAGYVPLSSGVGDRTVERLSFSISFAQPPSPGSSVWLVPTLGVLTGDESPEFHIP